MKRLIGLLTAVVRVGSSVQPSQTQNSEDVLVDRSGYVDITNNQGMWVLRYTGPRPAATN